MFENVCEIVFYFFFVVKFFNIDIDNLVFVFFYYLEFLYIYLWVDIISIY